LSPSFITLPGLLVQELLEPFARRLAHCASPELLPLLDLPGVKAARARQLHQAGYTSLASLARADPSQLVADVPHLSSKAAQLLVQAAKLLLVERAESLQEEADLVLLDMSG
jgi:POLQ-like helicase